MNSGLPFGTTLQGLDEVADRQLGSAVEAPAHGTPSIAADDKNGSSSVTAVPVRVQLLRQGLDPMLMDDDLHRAVRADDENRAGSVLRARNDSSATVSGSHQCEVLEPECERIVDRQDLQHLCELAKATLLRGAQDAALELGAVVRDQRGG